MSNYNNFEKEIPEWSAFIEKCKERAVAEEIFGDKGIKEAKGIHNRRIIAYYKNKFNSLAGK